MTRQDVRRLRKLRYEDGLSYREVTAITGRSGYAVRTYARGRPGKIPNDKLRTAFLASERTASEVARHLGWWDRGAPDTSRVKRTLGLLCDSSDGRRTARTFIDAETASLIAEAIGVMPWEILPDEDEEAA